MRGIDLAALRGESFSHPNHWAMMREHYDRAAKYQRLRSAADYLERLERSMAQRELEIQALDEAALRNRESVGEFTERQMRLGEFLVSQ